MSKEITEGLLFDLLAKRRAGHFTGDEILWAADHPDAVRWAKDHLDLIEGLRTGQLTIAKRELFPCERLAADLIPEGWTVVEDVEQSTFDISKLKPGSFLRDGESRVDGEVMRRRAVEIGGNLGLSDGKRMLAEQNKIPAEFNSYYVVLPGTVLRGPGGRLSVAYLYRNDVRWCLNCRWLDRGFSDGDRLACRE